MSASHPLAKIRAVQVVQRPGRPTPIIVFVALLLLLALIAAYVATMNAVVDVSRVNSDNDADRRDAAYAYLHIVFLVGAAVIGFLAGKWLNGLGIAFATLFVIVLVIAMLGIQLSSYELACRGHNDLVRHWQC